MPIFNQFLTCIIKRGNYHLITPRDWKSCDRQKWRRVWLPRVLNSLCPTLSRLILIQSFYTSQKPGTLADLSSDILKRAIRRKAAVCVEEQLKILAACHLDPTAGHMGEKRTVKRITERYIWNGIVKDVKEMVCYTISCYLLWNMLSCYSHGNVYPYNTGVILLQY